VVGWSERSGQSSEEVEMRIIGLGVDLAESDDLTES
jgi:hypothetical protein